MRRVWKRLFRDNLSDFSINWTAGVCQQSNFFQYSCRFMYYKLKFNLFIVWTNIWIRLANIDVMKLFYTIFFNQKVKTVIKYMNYLVLECWKHSTNSIIICIDLTNMTGVMFNTQHIPFLSTQPSGYCVVSCVLCLARCLVLGKFDIHNSAMMFIKYRNL